MAEEFERQSGAPSLSGSIMESPAFRKNGLCLFCGVRLSDLIPAFGGPERLSAKETEGWSFPNLVCHGTEVILADAVTAMGELCGISGPFFEGLPTLKPGGAANQCEEALARLEEWDAQPLPAAWRYEPRPIPQGDWPILAAKGLLEWEERLNPQCTPPYTAPPRALPGA